MLENLQLYILTGGHNIHFLKSNSNFFFQLHNKSIETGAILILFKNGIFLFEGIKSESIANLIYR